MKHEMMTTPDLSETVVQETIIQIWKELLRVEDVNPGDNFLLLGGESLLATQASARLHDTFGLEVPLRSILVGTVAEVAHEVAAGVQSTRK